VRTLTQIALRGKNSPTTCLSKELFLKIDAAYLLSVDLESMFGLSLGHLVIVTFVILLFGHRRLPEVGHALGKGIGAFKKGLEGKDHDKDDDEKPKLP
jgi:TatA/E family protein of Tat protein translocase